MVAEVLDSSIVYAFGINISLIIWLNMNMDSIFTQIYVQLT